MIYCLDNSSFCCADKDGQLSAISKKEDGIYHVIGEIVVVHEVTLAAAVTNLKRIILACGDRRVIIITPGPRYLTQPCCCAAGHSTLLGPPGCAQVFPLLEPGPPRFFWWYENSE